MFFEFLVNNQDKQEAVLDPGPSVSLRNPKLTRSSVR